MCVKYETFSCKLVILMQPHLLRILLSRARNGTPGDEERVEMRGRHTLNAERARNRGEQLMCLIPNAGSLSPIAQRCSLPPLTRQLCRTLQTHGSRNTHVAEATTKGETEQEKATTKDGKGSITCAPPCPRPNFGSV